MLSLYKTGYDLAVAGYAWRKTPPGYDTPFVPIAK
jgi:hypothetical protein